MRTFKLYPQAKHWFSLADYGVVLSVVERLRPQTVLEFGPGSSTLALIEGGAELIDACEDEPAWQATYEERLSRVYPTVEIHPYDWCDPLTIPAIDPNLYDMALIDGPRQTPRRAAVIEYCLDRCGAVLIPLEESTGDQFLRQHVLDVAAARRRAVALIEDAGPLAGAWALLT